MYSHLLQEKFLRKARAVYLMQNQWCSKCSRMYMCIEFVNEVLKQQMPCIFACWDGTAFLRSNLKSLKATTVIPWIAQDNTKYPSWILMHGMLARRTTLYTWAPSDLGISRYSAHSTRKHNSTGSHFLQSTGDRFLSGAGAGGSCALPVGGANLVTQHCDPPYRAIGYSYTNRIYVFSIPSPFGCIAELCCGGGWG